jgi:hypothetical protein
MQDLTGVRIYRNPSHGQISRLKRGVLGIRARARFAGSGSGAGGFYEAIYFGERPDWGGQREFGFVRKVNESVDQSLRERVYFYWSTNSNCSIRDNHGYPWCRSSQATTGTREFPGSVPLFAEHFEATEINNVEPSKQYRWVAYLFWASWDSTFKFRVEMWDATYTTQIAAFNADTIAGHVNFGASTTGMDGYVTLATQRIEPVSARGPLIVSSVEIVR